MIFEQAPGPSLPLSLVFHKSKLCLVSFNSGSRPKKNKNEKKREKLQKNGIKLST
jgi:hypothetical protein